MIKFLLKNATTRSRQRHASLLAPCPCLSVRQYRVFSIAGGLNLITARCAIELTDVRSLNRNHACPRLRLSNSLQWLHRQRD